MNNPIVLKSLLTQIHAVEKAMDWQPFRAGIQIARIYTGQAGADGTFPAAALLKYEAGACIPAHSHVGYEHIFILSGSQIDGAGEHFAGTLVINPPGSSHAIVSPKGCIVLALWEKPVVFSAP